MTSFFILKKRTKNIDLCFNLQVNKIFQDEDPVAALEAVVDGNLLRNYPIEGVYKVRFNLNLHSYSYKSFKSCLDKHNNQTLVA